MNRRTFLHHSSLLGLAGLLSRPALRAQARKGGQPPATPEFKPLRRDVGIFTARGGTIGWLANRDALGAIDTQFPDTAQLFLDGLPGRNGRRLDVVINTHHHGDHTGGNAVFKPAAQRIVAHANVPKYQRERAGRDGTLDRQVYPDTTFDETWRLNLGGETAVASYHGPGHTGGDSVTLFEKANVVHMGDLVFNRLYPFIDRPGGASIRGWIRVLETVVKSYPSDAVYIFGHANPKFGVTGSRADLRVMRDYLSGLLEYTEKRIKAGDPKEKIVTLENLPGFDDFHLPPGPQNRLPMNLSAAYDELTQRPG
jgi:cyclase